MAYRGRRGMTRTGLRTSARVVQMRRMPRSLFPSSVKHLRVLSEPNGFERFERFLNDSERSNFIFELNRDLVWVVVAGPLDIAAFGIAI